MRKYELVCVIHPDHDEAAVAGIVEKVKGWIGESGGTADKVEFWGRKALAYPIRKQKEGHYVLLNMSLPASAAPILEQNLRYLEPVIRYLLTVVD
ncbi:MAG: 30S ribosomal protein S6 [Anaerolineales bacterium]|nr:30S ribosomal protein S6 [Anaerolineales bacterium]MCX7609881.1 30S ribosomal protein S6 [Anaerolineales bacterium]MDW8227520.1 30S ribosomal protein S6 [Anaerolineales bacterium]